MKMKNDAFCRIAPFALYMAFVGLEEGLRFIAGKGILSLSTEFLQSLYPVKAVSVTMILFIFRRSYEEIRFRDLASPLLTLVTLIAGIGVFTLWIRMDFPWATMGSPGGFNPNQFHGEGTRIFLTVARLSGAVLVVPVMEELFWRSFLLRYIISQDFAKVPIGLFTWSSFLITVLLFGLEHNLFVAGIMAGIAYNLLLYYTRSISHCIVAHSVTNLALGIYVISTGKWYFW